MAGAAAVASDSAPTEGTDGAGKGRRKRLYLGPKPGPALTPPSPPPPAIQPPAQPAPQPAEPYSPRLPAVLQSLLDAMAPPVVEPVQVLTVEAPQVDRFADDDYAALIAAEMLLA